MKVSRNDKMSENKSKKNEKTKVGETARAQEMWGIVGE
jgi:hypothetical protein